VPNSENIYNDIVKENIDITYKTKPESLVSLLAIDKSLTFDKNDHDIDPEKILKALVVKEHLYDFAVRKNTHVEYHKETRKYVLNLNFKNKEKTRNCTSKETEILNKVADTNAAVKSSGGVNYYSTEESLPSVFDISDPQNVDKNLRRNFLKTWIWKTELSEDGHGSIIETVPDSLTTWLFTGFSINPDFGFALAQPQELIVSKKFFVELSLPYSIRIGEILTLDFLIFNFLSDNVNAKLEVYAMDMEGEQEFNFMELSDSTYRCSFNKHEGNVYKSDEIEVARDMGTKVEVLIEPKMDKIVTIRAGVTTTFRGRTYQDYIEKTIVVENEGVYEYHSTSFTFNVNGNQPDTKQTNFKADNPNPNSIEMKAIISGNTMANMMRYDQTQG
jgi:CD109 antigen